MRPWMRRAGLMLGALAMLGLVVGCGSSSSKKRKTSRKKKKRRTSGSSTSTAALPAPRLTGISLIMQKCNEMKACGARGDLGGAQRLMNEALAVDRSYAGDIYVAMATSVSSAHARAPSAQKQQLLRDKVEYLKQAITAYRAPGAKTFKPATIDSLVQRCNTLLGWAKRDLGG